MENSIIEGTGLVLPQTEEEKYQDPNQFPSELPQDMGNPLGDSMTAAYIKPVADERKAEEARKSERMDEIYNATKNLDEWEKDLTTDQKHRKVINGLIEVKLGYIPEDAMDYARARSELSTKYFDGKGGESDSALMGEVTKQSAIRQEDDELQSALQKEAFVGGLADKPFSEWVGQQESLKGSSSQRRKSLLYSYNEYKKQVQEQFGKPYQYAKKAYHKLTGDDFGAAVDYLESIAGKTTAEEHEQFLGLFREVVLANPHPKVDELMDAMEINLAPLRAAGGFAARTAKNTHKAFAAVGDLAPQAKDVAEEIVAGAPTPRSFGEMTRPTGSIIEYSVMPDSFKADKKRARAVKNANAFVADAKRIMRDDYDPIEPNFDGGALGLIESGIYAMPSLAASVVLAAVPYVGMPMVGGLMVGASRENFRGRMIADGVNREEASFIADRMGVVAGAPMLLLEKLQALAFIGKVPLMNKLMIGITHKFSSNVNRGIGRFTAANIGETNIEMAQAYTEEVVQMMGSAFDERIPEVQWTGEGGVFDGFAYQYLETAVQVAPLGITASIGGVRKDDRNAAFKATPREIRTMNGIRAVDNDRIDNAETLAEIEEAVNIGRANADPNSEEARTAVEDRMQKLESDKTSLANLQRAGMFPIIKADKKKDGVVEVIHPETGEVLDRIENSSEGVANSVISYMELQEQATQDQIDELATMVEVATIDVKESRGDTSVELDVGNSMDVQGLLEAFPEFAARVQSQIDRLETLQSKEMLNGGDGGMSRAVYGMNQVEHNKGQTKYVNKIYGNTSGLTVVHERTHSSFKRALDSGATTLQKAFDFMSGIDTAFVGKTDRKGNDIRFLPEGTKADDFVAIDEAMAEFSEVLLLQTKGGKKTDMREAVGRQMAAMVKSRKANAGSFKGFFDAMQDFFGKVLAQSFYLRKAISTGMITEGQISEFQAMLQGSTVQESFDKDVKAEMRAIQGESMSIGSAQDADYLAAVEAGDTEAAQAMVDEAAKAAGYTSPRVFHGTDAEFEKFKANEPNNYRGKPDLKGIYFSGDINRAGSYRRPAGRRSAGGGKPRMVRAYLKMDNPLNITQEIKSRAEDVTFGDAKREAISKLTSDNDSVVFDGDSVNGAEYIVFSPNQIKSADPVTYDSDGNVIPLSQRFDVSRDEISLSIGGVPAEIEQAKDPLVKHIFLKEDGKFYEKMKDGYVVVDQSLDQFEGMAIMLHQPDGAMAGTVEVDGEQVVAGKGGVYYPVMFGDKGYFWASTKDAAKGMAKSLNAISKRNNGTILMALTSAPIEKMFSSTTMSTGALDLFHTLAKNPKKYGVTKEELNKAIATGSQATLVKKKTDDETGEVTTTVKQFPIKLKESDSLDKNLKEMKKNLLPEASIFGQRGAFVQHIASAIADHMKLPTQPQIKKLDAKGKAAYEVKKQQALNIAKLLAGDNNLYNLSRIPKGDLATSSVMQGMADMFAEPLVKTFQSLEKDKKSPSGRVYAVLEMKGEVEPYETEKEDDSGKHESYPFALRSTSGQEPTVHVLENSNKWQDVVYAAPNKKNKKDKNEVQPAYDGNTNPVKKVDESSIFPPSSGVSMRELIVRKAPEDAESIPLSFSIGDRQMNETLITNAAMRMRDPEGVTTVMKTVTKKIAELRRDVPKIINAFGKEVEQHAIVDRRLMGDLRAEAAEMRREGVEAAENEVYEQYGEILSNEDLTALKSQPVSSLVLAEGGMESTSTAKKRKGDDALSLGEYEEAAGLPPMYYGGTQSPDQLAEQLFQEGAISDGDVSTMIEAIEAEITSVSGRKADLKKAKQMMQKGRKAARTKAQEWLDERISEQERDNNPMARARRALVKLSAIRRSLPMELRGKIEGDAKLLTMGDEARLKYLEETIAKVDKAVDKWIRTETKKGIKQSYKIIGKTKLTAGTEAEVVEIKRMGEMTALQVATELKKHHDVIDKETGSEAELMAAHEAIATLSTYGNQKDMGSAQLVSLLESLTHIVKTGRTIRAVKAAEKAARNLANQQMTIDVMSGGKGEMSRPERAKARAEREKRLSSYKFNKAKAKEFHGKNLAFEGLLNMISRKDKSTGTYESAISKKWQTMVHKATRSMKRMTDNTTTEYTLKMREIFGLKGVKLTNKIHKEFFNTDLTGTGIMIEAYEGGAQFVSDSIEISKVKQLEAGGLDLKEHGLTQADADAIIENYNKMIANPKSKITSATKVKWDRKAKSKKEELVANQGNAMSLIMMYRQDGIKQSMIKEGYTEEAMAKLEKDFLTDEGRQLMEWMSEKYDENYDAVNKVYREQHGVDLPKIEFYAPVKRQVSQDPRELEPDGGGQGFGSTPAMLKNRVTNFAEVDPNTNALRMFQSHMHQSNHYISWSATISELRATFNNMNVQRAMDDYVGVEIRQLINERINWMADGGNRQVKAEQWLDKIRMAHTFSSLAFDIGIMLKQWTSLPAYAFDMGVRNFAKYEAKFLENPIENAKEMIATEYVQLRFKDGYTRDVAEGLKLEGGNSFQNYMLSGLQFGMMFGKVGDITPVIMGGWAVKKHTYDQARKAGYSKQQAEAQSILAFEMATDRSQQAVDMKDLSSYSGGGSIAKLFTMYKTSPRQYYAVAWEAVADMKSGRKGATRGAIRKLAITHFVLPSLFQFASDSWRKLGDEDEEYEWSDYFRAWALGSLNGLFIAGDLLSPAASKVFGTRVYDANIPVFQAGNAVVRSFGKYGRGDFLEGSHEILKAAGKFTPAKQIELLTYYSVISKQLKNLGGRLND